MTLNFIDFYHYIDVVIATAVGIVIGTAIGFAIAKGKV